MARKTVHKAKKVTSITKTALWQMALEAMPKELGFSAEPLPSGPLELRFRVNGPKTRKHRIGHIDCDIGVHGPDPVAWFRALRANLCAWALEDRL